MTDRALRYRANGCPPPGEKICCLCASRRNVEVGHLDGYEENTAPENLIWNCRACNTKLGVVYKRLGIGRRTRQDNRSSKGATSLAQSLTHVMSMKGESDVMTVPAADPGNRTGQEERVCTGDLGKAAAAWNRYGSALLNRAY